MAASPHATLQDAPELGVVSVAAAKIADQQVRNRGTIGGSLANGDSAADLPAVLLALEGSVVVRGSGGEREIAAADLFEGYLTTAVKPGEVLTEVRIPALAGYGYGYEKFNRRSEDWAMVGVCALVKSVDGVCEDVRIGLTNMGSTPLRATATEGALAGVAATEDGVRAAAEQAADGTNPPSDLNGDADYRKHLATVLTRRAVLKAAGA